MTTPTNSDRLRKRVIEVGNVHLLKNYGPDGTTCHRQIASWANAVWPLIEAEIGKLNKEIEDLRKTLELERAGFRTGYRL